MRKIVAFILAIMLVATIAVGACAEHNHKYKTISTKIINPEFVEYRYINSVSMYKICYKIYDELQKCTDCPATRIVHHKELISKELLVYLV